MPRRLVLILFFSACPAQVDLPLDGGEDDAGGSRDAGEPTTPDGGSEADAGLVVDAGSVDAGSVDAGSVDAGSVADAGRPVVAVDGGAATICASLTPDTWTRIPGTAFLGWAQDGGIPRGAYRGSSSFRAMLDAFCDPAFDGRTIAIYGGGHGDGTCNAVVTMDLETFTYRLAGQPTPPSVYLPNYLVSSPVTYPSGVPFDGWFLTANELSDARDLPYAAPALARVSTHMYGAAEFRRGVVHYFYLSYGEFDVGAGTWSGRSTNLGQQLIAFRPQYGTVPLQQGTVAIYDEVTDRFFVTLNPGDSGGGWRTGFLEFNPMTRQIEHVYEIGAPLGGPMPNSANVVRVGRELYVFSKVGLYGQPTKMHQGFVFNLDSHQYRKFELEPGTEAESTFAFSSWQETIPSFYDGVAIRRWNYDPQHRAKILSVSTTPVRGTGTASDPLILRQTVRPIGGVIGSGSVDAVTHVYRRLFWDEATGCAFVAPQAASDWYALKLGS